MAGRDDPQWLTAVEGFRAEHGHTAIAQSYRTPDGRWLGSWISQRRNDFRTGKLTPEEVAALAAVGVDVTLTPAQVRRAAQHRRHDAQWDTWITALQQYRAAHGHANVPQDYLLCE